MNAVISSIWKSPPLSSPWIIRLLLRFAACYGIAFFLSTRAPVIETIETAVVWLLDLALRIASSADASRSLALASDGGLWSYIYQVELEGQHNEIVQPFHAHGFVVLLSLSMILATPGLSWRRWLICVAVGAGFAVLLCVILLMSDLQAWELEALLAPNAAPALSMAASPGPFPAAIGLLDALHRTAAAGLMPVCLWVLCLTHGRMLEPVSAAPPP